MTLAEATEGDWLVVTGISGDEIGWQAVRFGIDEGSQIQLAKKLPGGPVIVAKNQLEIAVGRALAMSIHVCPLKTSEAE